jgi:hypothetical protein
VNPVVKLQAGDKIQQIISAVSSLSMERPTPSARVRRSSTIDAEGATYGEETAKAPFVVGHADDHSEREQGADSI